MTLLRVLTMALEPFSFVSCAAAPSWLFDFNPEIRLKPLEPTGRDGLKTDAAHIAGYWRNVGKDISEAVEKYERKEK